MKITVPVIAALAGTLALTSGASALVASPTAVVQNISASFAGQPLYVGLQTYAVFVLYQSSSDVMVNHGLASIAAVTGTFFNANNVTDDPLGLLSDTTGGLTPVTPTPISPGIIGAFPVYAKWLWDTNLSSDNDTASQADPGSSQSPTLITGGAFTIPPPIGHAAGADLMIQIAQISMSTGGTFLGHTTVLTQNPAGGNPIATEILITNVPAPGALALLGLAGLVGTRRRRA